MGQGALTVLIQNQCILVHKCNMKCKLLDINVHNIEEPMKTPSNYDFVKEFSDVQPFKEKNLKQSWQPPYMQVITFPRLVTVYK